MRKAYTELSFNEEALAKGWIPEWPLTLRIEIGAFLLRLATRHIRFKSDCSFEDNLPVFTHKVVNYEGKRLGIIQMHKRVMKKLTEDRQNFPGMPLHFPMTTIPFPWFSINCGGYLLQFPTSPKLVRTKEDPIQMAILEECAIRGDLSNLMLGTDALGKTPWVINQRTLSVALELWNNKSMDVSTLKPIHPYVEPKFVPREQFATQAEFVEFVRNVKTAKEDKANSHSSQCDTNYKLEIARQVKRCLPFYFC